MAKLAETEVLGCENGRVSTDDIIFALLNNAGVPQSGVVYARFQSGELGTYMNARMRDDAVWIRLRIRARSLIQDGPSQPEKGYRITLVDPPRDPATALLNRDAQWLTMTCEQKPAAETPDAAHEDRPKLVVARSIADADKPTKDREFATLSFTKDYHNNEQIIATEIFIGLPGLTSGIGPNNIVQPYVAYQRRTGSEPLNDLTFGLSSRWFVTGKTIDSAFFLNGEFETDDDLRSRAYRAEFIWEPVLKNDPCGALTTGSIGVSCTVRFGLDRQSVENAGKKIALQDKPSFTRFGGDARFSAYWDLAASGSLHFDALYSIRAPFDGRGGKAQYGQGSLRFIPSGLKNVSFGVEYNKGRDPTSLLRSETLKLALGFRN